MDPVNKKNEDIKVPVKSMPKNAEGDIKQRITEKFDFSMLGKIDLVEAEKIASEEVIFLTEVDLIEGLEDFELVPIKNPKLASDNFAKDESNLPKILVKDETVLKTDIGLIIKEEKPEINDISLTAENTNEIIVPENDLLEHVKSVVENFVSGIPETKLHLEEKNIKSSEPIVKEKIDIELKSTEDVEIVEIQQDELEIISVLEEELPTSQKLFTVKINEETLDAQLASILNIEIANKTDNKQLEKYVSTATDLKCRFIDDQFLSKSLIDDTVSYNEDPLTERLVKMIEVADGKLELLEIGSNEDESLNYILEDYTLYNSEKFDNVFKEEVFYVDSDFDFIDNAIIRDDFTKYIHEIDDYFGSEESLIQSEISEILGLVPEENDYIEEKLFGDYYKRYDLDNEIDFIKPEIDFFRSSYAGEKNLSYFTENENSLLNTEKISIEEDISSPYAIVFEEDVSEIEDILRRDFDYVVHDINETAAIQDEIIIPEEITDITDRILILDDKEKMMELVSEFPEKHENLIRLLSYLDGLFEKLPEEVIRKFAESEYFELYSKVLKEMGV